MIGHYTADPGVKHKPSQNLIRKLRRLIRKQTNVFVHSGLFTLAPFHEEYQGGRLYLLFMIY